MGEHCRQTRGKQEAEGKAACSLAGLVPSVSLWAVSQSPIYHCVSDSQPLYLLVGGGGP